MTLKQKIEQDMKVALRAKDELRLSVLRMLFSAIKNREIEKRSKIGESELTEEEMIAALRSETKKRHDAMQGFAKGGRDNLVEKEFEELKILEAYLPQEITDEEIEKVIQEVISQLGEMSTKDFGRVMGEAMKRIKGHASGERVSLAVKRLL